MPNGSEITFELINLRIIKIAINALKPSQSIKTLETFVLVGFSLFYCKLLSLQGLDMTAQPAII